MTLLTRRAVVLGNIEDSYNTEKTLTAADGFLVEDPDFQVDPTLLTRNFSRSDLSPMAHSMGRKISRMTFRKEVRGNGLVHSGVASDAPMLTRLMRACGYSLTALDAASATSMFPQGDHANPVSWSVDDASLTNTDVIAYFLEVTTGGASATAEITVTSDTAGEGNAAAAVTTAEAFTIGGEGLEATPTFTGELVVGQRWVLWVLPTGVRLDPVSNDFESMTLKMYLDGVLHKITGALGTFTITAEAGNRAFIDFEFTGQFYAATDEAMPSPTYETALPPMVELARLRIDEFGAIVNAFNYTQGNDIQIRPDANSSDGYNGVRITDREPEGGIDPEATLVASEDFWGKMESAKRMPFQMRVGKEPGNQVWIIQPSAQYSGLTYQDRTGMRTYDAGLAPKRVSGNDEIMFGFF